MHHGLFVSGQVVAQIVATFEQRLSETGDVAVAEDAKATREEALLNAVAFYVLDGEEAHERLGDRQPHALALAEVIGSLGVDVLPKPGLAYPGVGGIVTEVHGTR